MVMDAVTSLGCVPVEIDHWEIDACYSCTQKGIGAPPGLAPVTFSERAMQTVRERQQKCRSWYFDVALIERYWGPDRLDSSYRADFDELCDLRSPSNRGRGRT